MSGLEVETVVSLYDNRNNEARWNINKDIGRITLYLIPLWDDAIDHSLFKEHDEFNTCLEKFIDYLNFTYVLERVCIERAHEKIRIKGGRCKPCCVRYFAELMTYPLAWDTIKKDFGRVKSL
jgi:hypothetical protein